jgi:hypothetical protein
MKLGACWVVAPCSVAKVYRRFRTSNIRPISLKIGATTQKEAVFSMTPVSRAKPRAGVHFYSQQRYVFLVPTLS